MTIYTIQPESDSWCVCVCYVGVRDTPVEHNAKGKWDQITKEGILVSWLRLFYVLIVNNFL